MSAGLKGEKKSWPGRCGIGSWGGQRPSLGGYVRVPWARTGRPPPEGVHVDCPPYLKWLDQAPPEIRHQRLHGSHYSHVDPEEARFLTADLIRASCLAGTPEELVERVRALEAQGLTQIMLYPPLNRQYRVIEDFAAKVMSRL